MAEILQGSDLYLDQGSVLELVCRVTSGQLTPAFILWKKENKVREHFISPYAGILKAKGVFTKKGVLADIEIRVTISKTFLKFLKKRMKIFTFDALHLCAKK